MTRTNQGGSGLSFIVVGIVLAALLTGGLYMVRQQTTQSTDDPLREEETVVIEDEKQEVVQEEAQPQPLSELPGENTGEQLPQTGPTENIMTIATLAALSFTVVAYVRSRRPELSF